MRGDMELQGIVASLVVRPEEVEAVKGNLEELRYRTMVIPAIDFIMRTVLSSRCPGPFDFSGVGTATLLGFYRDEKKPFIAFWMREIPEFFRKAGW